MKRAKKVALAGILGAVASLLLVGAVYLPVTFTLSIVASFVVVVPALVYDKSAGYCVAVTLVATAVVMLVSGRYLYVLPFVVFFAPYLIAKVYVDGSKLASPLKWFVKYAFLEVGLGLLTLLTFLLFKESWDSLVAREWFLWVFWLAPQVALVPYDIVAGYGVKYLGSVLKRFSDKS